MFGKCLSFLSNPIWLLFLTTIIFLSIQKIRTITGWSIFNPLLISTILLICYLKTLHISVSDYQKGGQFLSFWLQPAIVALAVPVYLQWDNIKNQWLIILLCELVGCGTGILTGVIVARCLGATDIIQRSIAAKSVTTPIFIDITNTIGGIPQVGFAGVMTASILGQMIGLFWLYLIKVRNPISKGLTMGTASNTLGVLAVWELNPKIAAFATIGMIVNGILTSIFLPFIVPYLF